MTDLAAPAAVRAGEPRVQRASVGWFRHQLPVSSPLGRDALMSAVGSLLGRGDLRATLTEELLHRFDATEVVLCGSGTDALARAIRAALDIRGGDTVALPAYSCYDVASACVGAGARIVLYDLDPGTLAPDVDSLRAAFAAGASAAVIAPLYGMPVDWLALQEAAGEAGALLIEDASQGQGAFLDDRRVGSLGDLSVISFGRGKGWTGGGGGALLVRSPELRGFFADAAGPSGELGQLVKASVQWLIGTPELYWLPAALPLGLGETVYHDPSPPRQLGAVAAAILMRTLPAADAAADYRRRLAAGYTAGLKGLGADAIAIPPISGAVPGYLRFPVRVPHGMKRLGGRRSAMRRGLGPAYPTPLHHLSAVQSRLRGAPGEFPGATSLVRDLITLPTHSLVSAGEADAIIGWVGGALSAAGPSARTGTGRPSPLAKS